MLAEWFVHSAIAWMQNMGRKLQIWGSSLILNRNNGEIKQKHLQEGESEAAHVFKGKPQYFVQFFFAISCCGSTAFLELFNHPREGAEKM